MRGDVVALNQLAKIEENAARLIVFLKLYTFHATQLTAPRYGKDARVGRRAPRRAPQGVALRATPPHRPSAR